MPAQCECPDIFTPLKKLLITHYAKLLIIQEFLVNA